MEIRNAQGSYVRLPGLAAELVRSKVDIIVAVAPAAIQAAKEATSSIPIVISIGEVPTFSDQAWLPASIGPAATSRVSI